MTKKLLNSLLIFFFLFIALVIYIFNKPKTHINLTNTFNGFLEEEASRALEIISRTGSNKLAKLAISQEEYYRKGLKQNIEDIQIKITELCTKNQNICRNFDSKKLIKIMLKDREILLEIGHFSWQNNKYGNELIYTNNMPEAIYSAINIIKNRSSLHAILAGKMPADINIDWNMPTLLGGVANKDIKGTVAMVGFIVSLGYVADFLKIPLDSYSAMTYKIDIPQYIVNNSEIHKSLINYTFFSNNTMTLFYNGQETGSYAQKIGYYPKDSSLWLEEIIGTKGKVSTLNLMSLYSEYNNNGFILWNKNSIEIKEKIEDELSIVSVSNIKDILPGMIIAERNFDLPEDIGYSEGTGGRLGIIVGVDYEKNNILAMSYIYDIDKNKNGFGIDIYEYKQKNNVLQMFFALDNDK